LLGGHSFEAGNILKGQHYVLKHMEIFYHHLQILLLLVEHRASMKSYQALLVSSYPLALIP